MKPEIKRCAVYTRKSTEEGLDQEFNSLDAQREACFAYITSQKFAGWTPISASYDDGGFSGGNMERPALQKLLNDVRARKIDVIVVYKIDRLSRTLVDFAKLLDLFDTHDVTFMSVTQSFNTTTSMGRLTMNILLSFAQFEREMTAERIRDKFAASKKKGIWMGGTTPTGYDVKNRQLVPNAEVSFVKMVYERYLELGTIVAVMRDLKKRGIKSPLRTRMNGVQAGGVTLTSGALRHMLMNPVYIGKIKHKRDLYDGLHPAILSLELWQKAQERLLIQSREVQRKKRYAENPSLLQGKLFSPSGQMYVPNYATKNGIKYKYYLLQGSKQEKTYGTIKRLSAREIESHVSATLNEHLDDSLKLSKILMVDPKQYKKILGKIVSNGQKLTNIGAVINKVIVDAHQYTLEISLSELHEQIKEKIGADFVDASGQEVAKITASFRPAAITKKTISIDPSGAEGDLEVLFDLPLKQIKDLVRGTAWREDYFKGSPLRRIAAKERASAALIDHLIQKSLATLNPGHK